jgi:predicted  nucleic acid-binding Zn-ribbon protein
MSNLSGMEKFSHLEDKIYLTMEFAKRMRDDKEKFENESSLLRDEVGGLHANISKLELKLEKLMNERDVFQLKIEAMLDAIAKIEPEVAEIFPR